MIDMHSHILFGVDDYAKKIFSEDQENLIVNKYFDNPKLATSKKGFISKIFK